MQDDFIPPFPLPLSGERVEELLATEQPNYCPCCGDWPCSNPWLKDRRPQFDRSGARVPQDEIDAALDAELGKAVA